MKDLEFLPEHHIRARQNQRLRFVRLWLLAILALSMVCWGYYSRSGTRRLCEELDSLTSQVPPGEVERQKKQLCELLEREKAYKREGALVEQLSCGWPRAGLVREIARCLPEQIVLTRLEIERQTRDVMGQFPAVEAGVQRGPGGVTAKETVDRVRLEGYAADDLSLSRFLQAMADGETFQRGDLAFSKDATFRNREVRVFAATFYVPVRAGASEEAAVGPKPGPGGNRS